MNIDIGQHTKAKIADLHKDGDKNEQCALLMGKRHSDGFIVVDALPVENTHPTPGHRYTVTAGDLRRVIGHSAYDMDDLIGVAHTHPPGSSADPSIHDVDELPMGYLGVVYHVTSGTITYFDNQYGFIDKETFVADRV